MTDTKAYNNSQDQGNYYQFNNPNTQQPSYQNQGYQSPYTNQIYQYQASPQNEYYNSYQIPVQQPHDLGTSPLSPSDLILSEKEQNRFYIFLRITMVWVSIVFGIHLFYFFYTLREFYFSLSLVLFITSGFANLLAAICCNQLINGDKAKDAKPFGQGKKIFIVLFTFECFYFVYWYLLTLGYYLSFSDWLLEILTVAIPAHAFAYIIWGCYKLEKLFGSNNNVSIAPLN